MISDSGHAWPFPMPLPLKVPYYLEGDAVSSPDVKATAYYGA